MSAGKLASRAVTVAAIIAIAWQVALLFGGALNSNAHALLSALH